eukprot:scaffold1793_cov163-Alexandrium_tamarense.AAC.1
MVVDCINHLKTFAIIQITLVGKQQLCLGAIDKAGVYLQLSGGDQRITRGDIVVAAEEETSAEDPRGVRGEIGEFRKLILTSLNGIVEGELSSRARPSNWSSSGTHIDNEAGMVEATVLEAKGGAESGAEGEGAG